MGWDFETDPEFQKDLDWIDEFVTEEVAPLQFVLGSPYDLNDPNRERLIRPLQKEVQGRGLWACHLGPELGGQGYGQLKLALMNEILGRAPHAPTVFGCQAPDSGNAEILAHYGTHQQKEKYLEPLLKNEIVSCYSMTEPQGGADPKVFKCRAELVGDEWVINGEKWFSSNARYASFNEMPFAAGVIDSFHMALADGPTEVHKVTVARQVLGEYRGTDDLFPTTHLPKLRQAALKKFADAIELEVAAE